VPVVLSRASGNPNFGQEWSVSVSRAGDYLLNTWLRVQLPAVTLSPTNRFGANGRLRYTRSVLHALCREISISFNDLVAARIDSYFLDFWAAFTCPSGKSTGYSNMVGNLVDLIQPHKPGETIPSVDLNLPIPLWYSRDSGLSIPTASLPYNEIRLNFSFRGWQDILILDEITGPGTSRSYQPLVTDLAAGEPQIPLTQVWGTYCIVSNDERKRMGAAPRDILIEQVQTAPVQSFNPRSSGGTQSYDIRFSHAVKCLFFAARNKTCPSEHSNYTAASPVVHSTPTMDYVDFSPSGAVDPIANASLVYENSNRLSQMSAQFFSLIQPWYHAPVIPLQTGYHLYSYSLDLLALEGQGSTNYGKLTNVSLIPTASDATLNLGPPGSGNEYEQKFEFIISCISFNIIRVSGGALGAIFFGNKSKPKTVGCLARCTLPSEGKQCKEYHTRLPHDNVALYAYNRLVDNTLQYQQLQVVCKIPQKREPPAKSLLPSWLSKGVSGQVNCLGYGHNAVNRDNPRRKNLNTLLASAWFCLNDCSLAAHETLAPVQGNGYRVTYEGSSDPRVILRYSLDSCESTRHHRSRCSEYKYLQSQRFNWVFHSFPLPN
jgi:hypothetical protein